MSNLLIGLLSCHNHRSRDILVEQTWKPVAESFGMQVVFLVGDGRHTAPTNLDGDYLHIPCPDGYLELPQKSAAFFRWAVARDDWDVLMKADNDTLVIPDRLAKFEMGGRDYVGNEWKRGVQYGSGGAGYFLSRSAAQIAAERLRDSVGYEDQLVGRYLRRAGITFTIDHRFDPWGRKPPTLENDIITTHKLAEPQWMAVWNSVYSHPSAVD